MTDIWVRYLSEDDNQSEDLRGIFEIDGAWVFVKWAAETSAVPFPTPESPYRVPTAFEALIEDPAIPYAIACDVQMVDGQPVCWRLSLGRYRSLWRAIQTPRMTRPHIARRRQEATEITTGGLRQVRDVTRLVRLATWGAMIAGPGEDPPSVAAMEALYADVVEKRVRPRRLDDAHYRSVADVYRAAVGTANPTEAVRHHFSASRSTAGRWVMEARRRGFLGATTPGRAGETRSTKRNKRGKR